MTLGVRFFWFFTSKNMPRYGTCAGCKFFFEISTHTYNLPLVWEPTSLSIEPLCLGIGNHICHYILYISLVALIAKVFLHGRKLAQRGPRTHTCKLPLVWEPTPLSIEPLRLGLKFHIRHYILYIWNIFWNYWTWILKPGQVLMSSNPSGSTLGNMWR